MIVNRSTKQSVEDTLRNLFVHVDAMSGPSLEDLRVCHVLAIIVEVYGRTPFCVWIGRRQDRFGRIKPVLLIVLQTMSRTLFLCPLVSSRKILPYVALGITYRSFLRDVHRTDLRFGNGLSKMDKHTVRKIGFAAPVPSHNHVDLVLVESFHHAPPTR